MPNIFANITARGTKAAFENALGKVPQVWRNHVTEVPSDGPDEQHVWLGMLPKPRQFLGEYHFEGLIDFTYNIENQEYEMSFVIDKVSMEDDRHGLVNRRFAESAEAWATFKDEQLKNLIEDNGNAYDATAFFADARVIGKSAAIDNNLGDAGPTDPAVPTAPEFLDSIAIALGALWTFQDDQGRTGYNASAMSNLRLIIPPKYQRAAVEAMESTLVGGGNDNPWGKNLAAVDVLPYLTAANNIFFISATGATRKPFIYQERTNLQVNILNGADHVAENHGVKVIVTQRYRLQYGEPRRAIKMSLT